MLKGGSGLEGRVATGKHGLKGALWPYKEETFRGGEDALWLREGGRKGRLDSGGGGGLFCAGKGKKKHYIWGGGLYPA